MAPLGAFEALMISLAQLIIGSAAVVLAAPVVCLVWRWLWAR